MTAHRPDLLPFAKYRTFGLPFHGLVKDGNYQADPAVPGTLHLPSTATMTYRQPYDGGTIMVQHPQAAALTRTAAEEATDTANDHQWLDYALLSGRLHEIGGQELGQHYHLYCDANYTWKIRTEMSGGTGSCTLKIYLNSLFGLYSDTDYTFSEKLLASYTWSPQKTDGNLLTGTVGNRYLATYSKTGAKMVLNVGTTSVQSGVGPQIWTQHNSAFYMHDAIRVTISGNGSLNTGLIGTGISAGIEHIIWGDDIYDVTFSIVGGITDDYSYQKLDYTYRYLYVTDKDGNETHLETVYDGIDERYRLTPYDPENPQQSDFDVEAYVTRTISFGGTTLTSEWYYIGYYWASGSPHRNAGSYFVNGVEAEWNDDDSPSLVPDSPITTTLGEFTADTIFPQVVIVVNENLPTRLLTAAGGNQVWTEDANQYYTHNPVTDDVQVNGLSRICYV